MPTIKPRTANASIVALCLALSGIALALHAPGHMSTDTSIQLHEAFTGRIESWAPPFMSALLYWLGLGTVGTSLFVLLNVASTYGAFAMSAHSGEDAAPWPWYKLALVLLLVANPVVFAYVGIVWKDVLLASLCVLSLGLSLHAVRQYNHAWAILFSVLALIALLPIPMVRQQGSLLLPIFALTPALQIAQAVAPKRRKFVVLAVLAGVLVGFLGLRAIVAASFEKGPDGRDLSVGMRIIKSYDLAGIQYRTGAEGPFAKAGASQAVLDAVQHDYDGDRVDRLGGNAELSAFFGSRSPEQINAMWLQAIREHPGAYLSHRLSAFSWLTGFHNERSCLPFLVGVDGIDAFFAESGIREEQELRDKKLFDWNLKFVNTPLWKHWAYIALLTILLGVVWFRRKDQRRVLLPWILGLGIFVGSFLPTSIACDFRYLYLVIPCTIAISLALLRPSVNPRTAEA